MGKEATWTYGFNLKCLSPVSFLEDNILMVSDQIKLSGDCVEQTADN